MDDSTRAFQMPLESRDPAAAREFSFRLAQLSLTDGIWQDQPDHLAAFTSERLGPNARGRGTLFVLLDVSGETEGRAELERELVEQIREAYAAGRGSVSFGLTEALRAANRYLHEANRALPREARRMAGVSAVCMRGSDLYIAQAGPALVYLYSQDSLTQYPAYSPWLEEDSPRFGPDSDASLPLGVQLEFASDLAHATVQPGDVIVIAMRSLAQLVSNEELQEALASKHADELTNFFESLTSDTDIALLVVELEPATPLPSREREGVRVESPTPLPNPAPLTPSTSAPTTKEATAAEPSAPAEETPEQKLERLRDERRRRREQQQTLKLPAVTLPSLAPARNALAGLVKGWSRANKSLGKSPTLKRAGSRTNRALNTAFGAFGNLLRQALRFILPGAPERERVMPQRVSSQPLWMKIVALVLPVLFIALAGYMVVLQGREQDKKFGDLLTQAQKFVADADNANDAATKRDKLNQAQAVLDDARKIHNNDSRAATIFYQIQDKKNELDGIDVLYTLAPIQQYADPLAKPARILAHENDIFVLDRGAQRIYHYTLNDAGTGIKSFSGDGSILKTGDSVGTDPHSVGELIDIAWADPGGNLQTGVLVAVDSTGLVMTFDPSANKWAAIQVDAKVWSPPTLIGTFSGNLYTVAPSKNQILRFVPTLAGYTQAPTNYFSANVDLSHVVNLAIDADVWLLRDDGTIARYRTGSPAAFNLSDNAPAKAMALFTSLTTNSIYIADGANQRLLQFDKNGKLQRQFKPATQQADTFQALTSLFVDELKSKIYFLSGNTAYLANLPK